MAQRILPKTNPLPPIATSITPSNYKSTFVTKTFKNCNDAQTLCSSGTNSTLHRRMNNSNLLTQSSLSLIFDGSSRSNGVEESEDNIRSPSQIPNSSILQGIHVTCSKKPSEEVSPIDDNRSVTMNHRIERMKFGNDPSYTLTARSALGEPYDLESNGHQRKLSTNLFGKQGNDDKSLIKKPLLKLLSDVQLNKDFSIISKQLTNKKINDANEQVPAINTYSESKNGVYLPVCDMFKLNIRSSRSHIPETISFEGWVSLLIRILLLLSPICLYFY